MLPSLWHLARMLIAPLSIGWQIPDRLVFDLLELLQLPVASSGVHGAICANRKPSPAKSKEPVKRTPSPRPPSVEGNRRPSTASCRP